LLRKKQSGTENYLLRLYITGITLRSTETISAIRSLCEEHLKGHYELEVVDIYQQPDQAMSEQIIAAPTLIKKMPPPTKRIVGNLLDRERVLASLDLQATDRNKSRVTPIQ
jgi:circadian clock protein KaiB